MKNEISIVDYTPKYKTDFKALNEEWIQKYFKIEQEDRLALNNPQEYIIKNGGYIAIAILNYEAIGVCALIKMMNNTFDYELAKMAVSPKAQGLGIGKLLGNAIINKAKEFGAKNIYIESNTSLIPAISLYKKLGFKEIIGEKSPYDRCNIQMELTL